MPSYPVYGGLYGEAYSFIPEVFNPVITSLDAIKESYDGVSCYLDDVSYKK